MCLKHFALIDVCSAEFFVVPLRICTGFKGGSFRETHLQEQFGRPDKIALITCLKKLNVSGAFLIFSRVWRPLDLRTPPPATEPRDGPTRNFHEKYRKNSPRPEILDSPEFTPKIPRKYRKNTPKIPKMSFWYFFGIWGYFLGVPKFRPGGYFFGIFCGNSGSGHLGAL